MTLTATAVLSPFGTSNVRAAEITDKPNIGFEITGNYTEKKISGADAKVINKAFGYDSGSNTVYVSGADAKGYINWDNSVIESWQVYETEVFQPVLSRDTNGNLVVGKDENGNVQKKWSTYAFYPTDTAGVITHQKELFLIPMDEYAVRYGNTYDKTNEELNQGQARGEFENRMVTDTYVPVAYSCYDYVLSENHFCLSAECDKHIQTINSHLGLKELTTWRTTGVTEGGIKGEPFEYYVSEPTQITDAYVIRVYYTADDIPLNWMQRNLLKDVAGTFETVEAIDVYGTSHGKVFGERGMFDFYSSIGTEDREFRYTDIWILPEGVETVLTLEDSTDDSTTNTPSNTPSDSTTPSDDNTSSDSNTSNDNNTSSDSNDTITTPSDSNDTTDNTTSSDTTDNTTSSDANDMVVAEPYVVDFSNADSQTVSKEDFASLLEANKESDVVIKSNNGVTFTFAKGTMTEVDGKESYDFSTSINNTYSDSMPSYIQKSSFVSQINFNYSGKLPATASIRFYVGTEYAGKTLYYSLMNEDNTFARMNSYVVDAEGYITVQQDHCSSYVLTTKELKSPKTNDTMVLFPVGILLLATGGIFVGMKKRKMV